MKFKVELRTTVRKGLEVEAKDYNEAHSRVLNEADLEGEETGLWREAKVTAQMDGPYFYPQGWNSKSEKADPWYDLHGPSDLIVIHTKLGQIWLPDTVGLMIERLKQIGLTVVDKWNGWDEERKVGSNSCTFKVVGRKDSSGEPMSDEDQAILLANP